MSGKKKDQMENSAAYWEKNVLKIKDIYPIDSDINFVDIAVFSVVWDEEGSDGELGCTLKNAICKKIKNIYSVGTNNIFT